MLDALKKKLGITAEAKEGDGLGITVDLSVVGADATNLLTEATEAALNDLAVAETKMAELTATVETLTAQLAAANAALAVVEKAKQEALAEAKAVKMAARRAVVVGTIGEAKADAFLLATETLDDAAFGAVSSALVGNAAAEASTALFTEVGVDAVVDTTKFAPESAEMRILKAKYPQGAQASNSK